MNESTVRTLSKTISWRVTGSASTFAVSYFVLGSFSISSSIAVLQLVSNTVLYYLHERLWNKIMWGKS